MLRISNITLRQCCTKKVTEDSTYFMHSFSMRIDT